MAGNVIECYATALKYANGFCGVLFYSVYIRTHWISWDPFYHIIWDYLTSTSRTNTNEYNQRETNHSKAPQNEDSEQSLWNIPGSLLKYIDFRADMEK